MDLSKLSRLAPRSTTDELYMHYTISQDLSGSQDAVKTKLLSALADKQRSTEKAGLLAALGERQDRKAGFSKQFVDRSVSTLSINKEEAVVEESRVQRRNKKIKPRPTPFQLNDEALRKLFGPDRVAIHGSCRYTIPQFTVHSPDDPSRYYPDYLLKDDLAKLVKCDPSEFYFAYPGFRAVTAWDACGGDENYLIEVGVAKSSSPQPQRKRQDVYLVHGYDAVKFFGEQVYEVWYKFSFRP